MKPEDTTVGGSANVNSDYKDIFKRACLIQFSSSVWQCSRTLDQRVMEQLGNSEWLRGRKNLINPELLGPIRTSVHQARNTIQRFSLPFPITSIYLVPKEALKIIDERLHHFKERYWNSVHEFEQLYEQAMDEARKHLKDLFNDEDYPADIREKFNFEWRYLALSVPGKSIILTPEIYEREKQKFQELMDETRDLAIEALRQEMSDIVTHLTEKLNGDNGKSKIMKGSMFNKLREFLTEFGTRNIFNDDKLVELAEQAASIIEGVSPLGFGYNQAMKDKIKVDMSKLKEAIDKSIEDLPRRMIHLPKDFQTAEEN